MNRENQDNLPIKMFILVKTAFFGGIFFNFRNIFLLFLARILSLKTKNPQLIIELR